MCWTTVSVEPHRTPSCARHCSFEDKKKDCKTCEESWENYSPGDHRSNEDGKIFEAEDFTRQGFHVSQPYISYIRSK